MNNTLKSIEREWLRLVKECPCSLCGKPGPSEAHHPKQGNQFSTVALCPECHRGDAGLKTLMRIHKVDDNDLINITVGAVFRKIRSS